jgi:hypothetical protein
MTRIVVTGGRNFSDRAKVYRVMDAAVERLGLSTLIEGEAGGLDTLAKEWAIDRGVPFEPYPAKWDEVDVPGAVIRYRNGKPYNAAAGGLRNQQMIDDGKPDKAIAFPGGTGTADMTKRLKAAGIQPYVIT